MSWFASLSWSHAALVVLAIVILAGSLWLRHATRQRLQATPVRRRASYVVDYSAARAKAIAWLGDRYLLAKPINRKSKPRPAPWDGAILPGGKS